MWIYEIYTWRSITFLGLFRNAMRRSVFLLPLFLLCAFLFSCTKDKQEQGVQPALATAQSMHHMAGLWEMMYLTTSGQASAILPAGVRVSWVDSTLADWDGLEFFVDLGKRTKAKPWGSLCRDGYFRSGIYRASLGGDAWVPGLYMALIMNGKDSCTLSNGKGLYRFEGRMHFQVKPDQLCTVEAAYSVQTPVEKLWLEAAATVQLLPDAGTALPAYSLSGNGSLRNQQWQFLWDTQDLMKKMDEQGSFQTGAIVAWKGNDRFTVDFDPFGNEASDRWMKVWKGRHEFLFELD